GGNPAGRREYLPLRCLGPFPRSDRGEKCDPRKRILAAGGGPFLCQRRGTHGARRLSPADHAYARSGRRELRDARDRAVLAAAVLYRPGRERRHSRRRLSPAVLPAAGAALLSGRHGAAGGGSELAVLPLWWRAESGAGRHRRGFPALRHGQDHRRLEQGRPDGAFGRCRIAAGRGRPDRSDRPALPGGRVMALPAVHPPLRRRRTWCGALLALVAAVLMLVGSPGMAPAQQDMLSFPARPKPTPRPQPAGAQQQMLVRAEEINYDYTNERVSAV